MGLLGSLKSLLGSKVNISAKYELVREAISGTMSNFYKAKDRETGQTVGLKVCDQEKTDTFEARFKGLKKPSEGEIALSLDHPAIVKTFTHGITTTGQQFLVMEYLDGQGLNSLIIGRSPLLNGRRVALIRQAAEAISAMHKTGYLHRDICPRNFVASKDGTSMKLIDFGLSLPATAEFMTPGNRTGTPNYMAPEIVRRKKTDQRVDVFSFGVTAYEICTGHLPWGRGTDGKAALSHDTEVAVDIRKYRPKINPQLATAIMKCVAVNPDDRPQTMDQFLKMIEGIQHEDVA